MAPLTRSTTFEPPFPQIVGQLTQRHYAAICGPNNSGKSYILKQLKSHLGRAAYFVGPARFYHVSQIGTSMKNPQEYAQIENTFNQNLQNPDFNYETNVYGLERIIANLSNTKRDKLFQICSSLLGNHFSMLKYEEDNDLSPRYIDMDGQNISIGSSGTRMLMTLIGLCMDENFNYLLIDEPELGLGPKIQLEIGRFLANREARSTNFPHLASIYVATHSHLFLDRKEIRNNFAVQKAVDVISFEEIDTISRLHELQFNLLGNSLESLFLPGGFIFVEGKTDQPFIDKIIRLRFPDRNIVVTPCNGDVKRRLYPLKESLGDIYKTPFRGRTFVVLDSVVPNPSLRSELVSMGILEENIISWARNGIEYVYPINILGSVFGHDPDTVLKDMAISGDDVSLNGVIRRKAALSEEVCASLNASTPLPEELEEKLLGPVAKALT